MLRHREPDAAPEAAYVSAGACRSCHPQIANTYRMTGMGRSFYRPGPTSRVEDFTVRNSLYHRASNRYYTMTERDGEFYQRRHQKDLSGAEENVVEKRIDYVIGSGNHARSYLHRTNQGKLVELPVSWYTGKDGHWEMSPGYDRPDHQDFRRVIQEDCFFCHTSYPDSEEPGSIDCQRCHGPGSVHIKAAAQEDKEAIRRGIVNPARLSRDRQLAICLQCHLETTSRPLPHMIRRFDRGPFSYRPGEALGAAFLFFDHAPNTGHDGKFEIAHTGYRLAKSECFRKSQMTCTTCHNPHNIPRGSAAATHYAAVCRSCHASAHPSGTRKDSSCLDCHMPKRRASDAVHVVMTDHHIQRQASKFTEASEPAVYRGEVVPYYPLGSIPAPDDELYTSVAQVQHGSNLRAGIPQLEAAIGKHRPAAPEFQIELGRAYVKDGQLTRAIETFENVLQRHPASNAALRELGAAKLATGSLAQAAAILERAISGQPDAAALTNLGNAYLRQGDIQRAQEALSRALSLDPDLPDAHNLLGLAASGRGDHTEAGQHFREAIRLQPDLAEAQYNLGKLLAARREYKAADSHFIKALESNPAYAEARHSHALILLLAGSVDQAIAELRETIRIAPGFAEAHTDLAELLAAGARGAEAQKRRR